MNQTITIENTLTIEEIRNKIAQLSTTDEGESLKKAMSDLKVALLKNPAACSLMLPEDIGECVKHLTKITMKDIVEAASSKKEKNGKVKVPTQEELKNVSDDDW